MTREKMKQYRKTLTALAGVVVLVVGNELGTDSKWYVYLVALAAAVGVYVVPNKHA